MRKGIKNKLFLSISEQQINLDNLDMIDNDNKLTITYKPFNGIFKYEINDHPSHFDLFVAKATHFAPGFPLTNRLAPSINGYVAIDRIIGDFIEWMNTDVELFSSDLKDVDLWEEYKRGSTLLTIDQSYTDNQSDFTAIERQQIRLALNDLRLNIPQHFQLEPEQLESVNNRIDYLSQAVDRLNKTDWKGILIAQYIALLTTMALNPDQAKNLYDLFIKVLHIIPLLNH